MSINEQYDKGEKAKLYAAESLGNESKDLSRKFLRVQVGKLVPSSVLLDVGCGSGLDLAAYKKMGLRHLYGVDPSSKLLEEARQSTEGEAALSKGSFEQLPFEDNNFDVLTSRFSLHYSANLPLAIKESARVLKPGGKFMVIVSHPFADNLETKDAGGNITITLFKKAVSITFPQHS